MANENNSGSKYDNIGGGRMRKVYNIIETSWGYAVAVWTDRGLWELSFPRREVEEALADLTTPDIAESEENFSEELARQLRAYFGGYRVDLEVPVDWSDYTFFQVAALKYITAEIPYGKVATYGQVAAAIGAPKAARAVGGAMHSNRTPLVVAVPPGWSVPAAS